MECNTAKAFKMRGQIQTSANNLNTLLGYLKSPISIACIALLSSLCSGSYSKLKYVMVDFACNDAFVFTGTSLGFGAGDLTKLKWSMDLKQRFAEIINFLSIISSVVLHKTVEPIYNNTCHLILVVFIGFQCEQCKCGNQDEDRTSYRRGESQDKK